MEFPIGQRRQTGQINGKNTSNIHMDLINNLSQWKYLPLTFEILVLY